jgi:hypothetical protein
MHPADGIALSLPHSTHFVRNQETLGKAFHSKCLGGVVRVGEFRGAMCSMEPNGLASPESDAGVGERGQIFLRSGNLCDEYRQLNENYGCCTRTGGWVVG